ncbi:unnamed protein product [Parnassius apollo]|uniref:(apollo) hypothetical protein n=1 Tax=Parnassius apollo TaxID=110799 RepID=A0A8S3XST6_PARAO|nr:unnamed protein product [Parnassius apollo]
MVEKQFIALNTKSSMQYCKKRMKFLNLRLLKKPGYAQSFGSIAIVVGNSMAKLGKNNIYSYYWDETSHCKVSNEIISAVYDFFKNFEFGDKINILRIVSDGYAGQNKNTGMIAMLGRYTELYCTTLYTEAPTNIRKI